jgi:hypothetical protein
MVGRRFRKVGGDFGFGDVAQTAAVVGMTTAYNRAHPESGVMDTLATAVKYFTYFIVGFVLFIVIFIIISLLYGKKQEPPPADTTNAASGTPPPPA